MRKYGLFLFNKINKGNGIRHVEAYKRRKIMKTKMRKIDLYITYRQYEILKAESEKKEVPFSEILRKMIDFYEEKKNG